MARPQLGYRNGEGRKIIGSTSVLKYVQTMDSDILCSWAAKLARQGKDWKSERSAAGDHGTMLHELCETRLPHALVEADKPANATPEAWEKLKLTYAAIRELWRLWTPQLVFAEEPLVSELHQFGGTLDGCAKFPHGAGLPGGPLVIRPGATWLYDFKTGSQVGAKEVGQMASYRQLLLECKGIEVEGAVLLHAPTKEPGYVRPVFLDSSALDDGWELFKCGLVVNGVIPRLQALTE